MPVAFVRLFRVVFETEGCHELDKGGEGGGHDWCEWLKEAKRAILVCMGVRIWFIITDGLLQHLGNRTGRKALVAMGLRGEVVL